jgi:hypothetical protein
VRLERRVPVLGQRVGQPPQLAPRLGDERRDARGQPPVAEQARDVGEIAKRVRARSSSVNSKTTIQPGLIYRGAASIGGA